jgi:hydroxyacylglutathione hydrolase
MHNITAISAFEDNYIWTIHNDTHALVVDPGDAAPVLDFLAAHGLTLSGILCTHRHMDHVGGIERLRSVYNVPVYGNRHKNPHITHELRDGSKLMLNEFDLVFDILEVPGHVNDHLAFYAATLGILFCGDVLFGAGCGKNFEGTTEQLHHSLKRLSQLPDETVIYCAHEYTLSNLRFALVCEPGNADMQKRADDIRRQGTAPTVPFTLTLEKATNPFLRCKQPEIILQLQQRGLTDTTESAVFTALRKWRDNF